MYPADHPFWKFMRLVVLGCVLCIVLGMCLAFNYKNGWAPEDVNTLLITLASLVGAVGGYDVLKARLLS